MQIRAVDSTDPVIVSQIFTFPRGSLSVPKDFIELRIGDPKPGITRLAFLTVKEARAVAIALLQVAEVVDSQ